MAHIYLSLGSNIDKARNIVSGIDHIKEKFTNVALSSLYECEAVGFDGDSFYNLVASADTDLGIAELAHWLRALEFAHGRPEQAQKFSSRTLDIDLLLYDDVVTEQPVQLPRAEILSRAFVLLPLAEIASERLHPLTKRSYQELWHELAQKLTEQTSDTAAGIIHQQAIKKVPALW